VIEQSPAPDRAGPHGPVPTLLRRFGALMVDWVLCLLVANLLVTIGLLGASARDLWPLAVLIVEYALFVGLFAQTPGMALLRLRCVSYADGGRIGVPRAALRGALLCLVVPALLMDHQRRGLHDRFTGSIVTI
jgi:uncharacterized RDD family membrane protein YckC